MHKFFVMRCWFASYKGQKVFRIMKGEHSYGKSRGKETAERKVE